MDLCCLVIYILNCNLVSSSLQDLSIASRSRLMNCLEIQAVFNKIVKPFALLFKSRLMMMNFLPSHSKVGRKKFLSPWSYRSSRFGTLPRGISPHFPYIICVFDCTIDLKWTFKLYFLIRLRQIIFPEAKQHEFYSYSTKHVL